MNEFNSPAIPAPIVMIPPTAFDSKDTSRAVINYMANYSVDFLSTLGARKLEESMVKSYIDAQTYHKPDTDPDGLQTDIWSHPSKNMFGNSNIGAITFCPKVNGKNAKYFNTNDLSKQIELKPLTINTCLVHVSSSKEIVRTKFIGRNGTVKTAINDGDMEITISLIVVPTDDPSFSGNYNGIYPYQLVHDLRHICSQPCTIEIANDFLSTINITHVVVTNFEMGEEQGSNSQQIVTISCISDNAQAYRTMLNY